MATSGDVFVHTGSDGDGDGSARTLTGSTCAYASMDAAWDSLGTLTGDVTIHCAGTRDSTPAVLQSLTVGSYTVTIAGDRDADLYSGGAEKGFYDGTLVLDTSYYHIYPTSGTQSIWNNRQKGIILDGLQIRAYNANYGNGIYSERKGLTVKNCRIQGGSQNYMRCLSAYNQEVGTYLFVNNIFNECTGANGYGIHWDDSLGYNNIQVDIHNNAFFKFGNDGLFLDNNNYGSGCEVNVHNNVFANNGDDFVNSLQLVGSGWTLNIDYNAADDADLKDETNGQDMSPGTPESDGWADAWTDPNNGTSTSRDFTVLDTGSVLYQTGVAYHATNYPAVPQTDILGVTRDATSPCMGPFELEAAAGGGGPTAGTLSLTGVGI